MSGTENVFWLDEPSQAPSETLAEDISLDVAIVGGGIVGLTAAHHLQDSGLKVAVFEARRVGRQATGRSTAKVTSQHGLRYAGLISNVGLESARLYAEANQRAVGEIAAICARIEGRAGLEERPAYVYASDESEAGRLREEDVAARKLGLPSDIVTEAGLPFPTTALLRFAGQYQFDPHRYLVGLAKLVGQQVRVFEQARVTEVSGDGPFTLSVNGREVTARHVVVSTHSPTIPEGMFFAKAFPFAHPVVAAPLSESVSIEGMFISAGSPTHSFRTAEKNGRTHLVAVGAEYKTGEDEQRRAAMEELSDFLARSFGIRETTHAWTNEDFRPMDGVAFVGPASAKRENLLVATGFDAWGITQGTVAGDILAARVMGRAHPCAELFDATRLRPLAGGGTFVTENLKSAAHLIGDRVLGRKTENLDQIAPGQGGVITAGGEKLAVRKDEGGAVHALSAVCTHMGCVVAWNPVDRSWDCPCHGSRFDENGEVLNGPAVSPLERRSVPRL